MKPITSNAAGENSAAFFALIRHPLKLKVYLIKNVPAAFFSGVKVVAANEDRATVSVPYKWFTRNPFRSTYFACLSMAAELTTGILSMANVYKRKPAVSLIVTAVDAVYLKKATGLTVFECNDGWKIKAAVQTAVETKQSQVAKAYVVGRNLEGEAIAEFWFSWSFKCK